MTIAIILIGVGVLIGWVSGELPMAKLVRESALKTLDEMF